MLKMKENKHTKKETTLLYYILNFIVSYKIKEFQKRRGKIQKNI